MTANNTLQRTGGHGGRTVLAMDCVLAGKAYQVIYRCAKELKEP